MTDDRRGADLVWETLAAAGVRHAFGMPGTQTLALYDALRRSSVRSVLTTHELAAAFAAGGYYRASGRLAVLLTIPGPGFTYALTGLAEARLDSAALLHLSLPPPEGPPRQFRHQRVEQSAMASPVVKAVLDIRAAAEITAQLTDAVGLATSGEPGPVLVQIAHGAIVGRAARSMAAPPSAGPQPDWTEFVRLLAGARRPLLFAGQGAAEASALIRRLAEARRIPVVTGLSGRGVMPEDHPLAMGYDSERASIGQLNRLIERSDLVAVLGHKLSHGATGGFALALPADRTIQIDTSDEVLGANYPARGLVRASVDEALREVLRAIDAGSTPSEWPAEEIAEWRRRCRGQGEGQPAEPRFVGAPGADAAGFFSALRGVLPHDAIVVTDAGLHQVLTRRHWDVQAPRGLIAPSDFQSMGFGIPAAIGAALAAPERRVVAVIGDGGFLMSALELVTAVREKLPLVVIVFNDRALNMIRVEQQQEYGWEHDVRPGPCDVAGIASAVGAEYLSTGRDVASVLGRALASDRVTVVETFLEDGWRMRQERVTRIAKEGARSLLGARMIERLKRLRHR